MTDNDFDRIKKQVRQFVVERDWDQFHSPKNLSMALIVEAAEMVEHFQWLTDSIEMEKYVNIKRQKQSGSGIYSISIGSWTLFTHFLAFSQTLSYA